MHCLVVVSLALALASPITGTSCFQSGPSSGIYHQALLCLEVFEKYEASANAFGCSLLTPRKVWRPEVSSKWLVQVGAEPAPRRTEKNC